MFSVFAETLSMMKLTYYIWKVFLIGTVRYNWPMSAHASQAFSIAHCTDSEVLSNLHYYSFMDAAAAVMAIFTMECLQLLTNLLSDRQPDAIIIYLQ